MLLKACSLLADSGTYSLPPPLPLLVRLLRSEPLCVLVCLHTCSAFSPLDLFSILAASFPSPRNYLKAPASSSKPTSSNSTSRPPACRDVVAMVVWLCCAWKRGRTRVRGGWVSAGCINPRHDGKKGRGGGGVAAGKLGDEVDLRFPTSPHGYKDAVAS